MWSDDQKNTRIVKNDLAPLLTMLITGGKYGSPAIPTRGGFFLMKPSPDPITILIANSTGSPHTHTHVITVNFPPQCLKSAINRWQSPLITSPPSSNLIILISISDLNLHFLLAHCPPWWLMEKPTKIGSDFGRTGNCKMPPPGIVLAEILVGSAEKYWSGKRSETYCFWKVRSILGRGRMDGKNLYEMFAA